MSFFVFNGVYFNIIKFRMQNIYKHTICIPTYWRMQNFSMGGGQEGLENR